MATIFIAILVKKNASKNGFFGFRKFPSFIHSLDTKVHTYSYIKRLTCPKT